jgi:hypothetical protein
MACASADRGLRLRRAPRYLIRDRDGAYGAAFISAHPGHGHSRTTGLGAVALAERICREADRLDPTGMS